jgi:hypothetical protein
LRTLFRELVWRRFMGDLEVADPPVADYVSDVLTDFARTDRLYRIRDAAGRRLEEVAEMLLASNPLLAARSFDHERELRRHIGDFTLFFTGLFPEWLGSRARERRVGADAFIDYIEAGKESYAIVSEFDQFEYATQAQLFRRLAETFELCVFGLNLVKGDLERLHAEGVARLRSALGGDGVSAN